MMWKQWYRFRRSSAYDAACFVVSIGVPVVLFVWLFLLEATR